MVAFFQLLKGKPRHKLASHLTGVTYPYILDRINLLFNVMADRGGLTHEREEVRVCKCMENWRCS
jgi:hypothetical protein